MDPEPDPFYELEPKLDSGSGSVYESEPKIGFRPGFLWVGTSGLVIGESDTRLQP